MNSFLKGNGLDSIELISELSLEFGPSGCECRVRDKILKIIGEFKVEAKTDRLGNLICLMRFGDLAATDRKRIMFAAHMDEVGFMVDGITSEGMLTFGCVGGISSSVIAGRKVLVGDEEKLYRGVICSKAIHHKSKDERKKALEADKLYIDLGFDTKEETEKHIKIGDLGTFDSEFYRFGKDSRTLKCKALDDRMGCAALIEIMSELDTTPT